MSRKLTAYQIRDGDSAPIEIARADRKWLDQQKYAYRCLPLAFANQFGWQILSTHSLRATWDGDASTNGLVVEDLGGEGPFHGASYFGTGILSFLVPYLFRTPEGWNLFVRGPTNNPKDGIAALDAVIETDWAHQPFTMNWRFTRPCTIQFEVGEPICFLFPMPRGLFDDFVCEIHDLASDAELEKNYREWVFKRTQFLKGLREGDPDVLKQKWQKDYTVAAREKHPTLQGFKAPKEC